MPNKPTAKAAELFPLTLEQYSRVKQLPVDWLVRYFGLKNVVHAGQSCIVQPYTKFDGTLGAPRYRYGNAKQSPHNSGSQIFLYGQQQIIEKDSPFCILVEGESDTQTLRFAAFNVLGIPGTSMWDKCIENDPTILEFFNGKTVCVIQEPPSQAEQVKGIDSPARMFAKIKASLTNSAVVAVKLWEFAPRDSYGQPLYKDVSGLWLHHGGFAGVGKFQESLHIASRAAGRLGQIPQRSIDFIRASTVEMKLTRWLWENRVPLNKVTSFAGMAERGKSTVATDFLARLTKGADFPDCKDTTPPCHVLILASEEDYDEDICPRLTASGADLDRIHFAERSTVDGKDPWPIALDRDLELLKFKLQEYPDVKLIVMDPVTSYIGEIDPNKPKEVRPFIDALKRFAKTVNVSVLLIMHFSKNPDVSAIHRAGGAATWTDAPRAVWMFDKKKDEDDSAVPRTYVMVPGKLNKVAADKRTTLEFHFVGVPIKIEDEIVNVGAVAWGQETNLTMDQQFEKSDADRQKPGLKPAATEAAMTWVREYLCNGPRSAKALYEDGKAAGHKYETLQEAKKRLGIRSQRVAGGWEWQLADSSTAEQEVGIDVG